MDKDKREIYDFMNVESFSQLPFIWSTPKEKGIKLFGIEFGSRNVVSVSSTDELESSDTITTCEDGNRNNNHYDNNNNNNEESSRRFECHYCCRNFPTSQALGGHQNAHKRERQHAKRAQLQHGIGPFSHGTHVYGHMNYHRLAAATATLSALPINNYPSWNTNSPSTATSTAARFDGARYSPAINGSPLATWRISATRNNAPSFGSQERSLLNPLPLFAGDEMRKGGNGAAVGGGGSGGSHQTRFVYDVKSGDQVSLDLHL